MKTAAKILKGLLLGFLLLLFLANAALFLIKAVTKKPQPTLLGWSWAVVLSGSMEPALSIGDFIVFHRQKDYKTGDIIAFEAESVSLAVTHRIVEKLPEGYRTQGDNNNIPDEALVTPEHVIGRVVCVIPKIGNFIEFFKTPLGFALLFILAFLLIEGPAWLRRLKRRGTETDGQ